VVVATLIAVGALCSPQAQAQVPARFYWKNPFRLECGARHLSVVERQHESIRPAHTSRLERASTRHWHRGLCAHFLCSIGQRWQLSFFPWDIYRAKSRGWQDLQSIGQWVRRPMIEFNLNCHRPASAERHPGRHAHKSLGFLSTCSPIWRCRLASMTAHGRLNIGQNRWYGRFGMRPSSRLARGCRASARLWNCCPPCGSSETTTIMSGRR